MTLSMPVRLMSSKRSQSPGVDVADARAAGGAGVVDLLGAVLRVEELRLLRAVLEHDLVGAGQLQAGACASV